MRTGTPTCAVHVLRHVPLLDALPSDEAQRAGALVLAGQLDWLTVSWTHGLLPAALQFYTVHENGTMRLWRSTTYRWTDMERAALPMVRANNGIAAFWGWGGAGAEKEPAAMRCDVRRKRLNL